MADSLTCGTNLAEHRFAGRICYNVLHCDTERLLLNVYTLMLLPA